MCFRVLPNGGKPFTKNTVASNSNSSSITCPHKTSAFVSAAPYVHIYMSSFLVSQTMFALTDIAVHTTQQYPGTNYVGRKYFCQARRGVGIPSVVPTIRIEATKAGASVTMFPGPEKRHTRYMKTYTSSCGVDM